MQFMMLLRVSLSAPPIFVCLYDDCLFVLWIRSQ